MDLTQVIESLGLTTQVNSAANYLKAQAAAFKALPLAYDTLAKEQGALAPTLQAKGSAVDPADLAAVQQAAGDITTERAAWNQLDPQVDAIARSIGSGANLGDIASVAAGMVTRLNQKDSIQKTLDNAKAKYLSAAEQGALGLNRGISIGELAIGGLIVWLLIRKK